MDSSALVEKPTPLACRAPQSVHDAIQERADAAGVSKSRWVLEALIWALEADTVPARPARQMPVRIQLKRPAGPSR